MDFESVVQEQFWWPWPFSVYTQAIPPYLNARRLTICDWIWLLTAMGSWNDFSTILSAGTLAFACFCIISSHLSKNILTGCSIWTCYPVELHLIFAEFFLLNTPVGFSLLSSSSSFPLPPVPFKASVSEQSTKHKNSVHHETACISICLFVFLQKFLVFPYSTQHFQFRMILRPPFLSSIFSILLFPLLYRMFNRSERFGAYLCPIDWFIQFLIHYSTK